MMVKNVFRHGQKTAFWIGCACVGTYIAYRYWRQWELKLIDEGFEEVIKIDEGDEKRIVLLGLDGAGKTSIMQQLCVANGDQECYSLPSQPTHGSSTYRIKHGASGYYIWDIGGANPTKKYWSTFLQDTDLLVFVVDASDQERLPEVLTTLKELLGDSRIGNVPILVVANKQDSPSALNTEHIHQALDLSSIPQHKHKIEILPCQTRPLPDLPVGTTEHTWYHQSVDAVRKKIFAMAT